MSEDKRPTTVRFEEPLRRQLEIAASILGRSQTSILAEGFRLFLEKHPLLSRRYQLSVNQEHIVLMEIDNTQCRIKEVKLRNGTPVSQIAAAYTEMLRAPVQVVEEK